MNVNEAQRLHEMRQRENPDHDRGGCWCCCFDCDFDFAEVIADEAKVLADEPTEAL